MQRRVILLIVTALLLLLPLVGLMSYAVAGRWYVNTVPSQPSQANLVPMLDAEARQGLLTYKRKCRTNADCEQPLRCFFNMLVQHSYCADSTCLDDRNCPEGFACQSWSAKDKASLVRTCSLVGLRGEGEVCKMLPREREDGCARGLVCRGRCGRPCQPGDPTACAGGFFCMEDVSGPACQPSCEGHSCAEGQQCVAEGQGVSACARVHGDNCQKNPCPEGTRCSMDYLPSATGVVWMQCLAACGSPERPSCPEGTQCYLYRCRKSCTVDDPATCEPGFACMNRSEQPQVCIPNKGVEQ